MNESGINIYAWVYEVERDCREGPGDVRNYIVQNFRGMRTMYIYEYDERSSNNAVGVATGTALLLVRGSRCDILGGEEGDKRIHWWLRCGVVGEPGDLVV